MHAAFSLIAIASLSCAACAATGSGSEAHKEHAHAVAAAPCPQLVIEEHASAFVIEKRACTTGGLVLPRQLVVPTLHLDAKHRHSTGETP